MSAAYRTSRWVGIRPLKLISEITEGGATNPRAHIAKVYETMGLVLESLWAHHLKYEFSELSTLLMCPDGAYLATLLEQKTRGFFLAEESKKELHVSASQKNLSTYPGHATICLLILASAKNNPELNQATDLCESIAECLRLIQSHLNQGFSENHSEKLVIARLVKRWKQNFPYSE
jgi:hypothetical protein